ncbi:MAG: hypothetical protein QG673_1399 [Pseudomonadota bacterium]|jgi:glycosyltransferase involved in cell wall biosynthesis|nr:hypothetical protein [Pseudomonadota bacterium]
MKIVQVINSLGGAGAEKLVFDLALLQHELGHEVTVITLYNFDDIYGKRLATSGVPVINLGVKKFSVFTALKLRRYIKKISPDIVHSNLFPANYYAVLSLIGLKINKITTEHCTLNNRNQIKLLKPLEAFIYGQYDIIAAIGDGVETLYKKYLPEYEKRIIKINNGVDICRYQIEKVKKQFIGIDENMFIVTMTARFEAQKDQETLIRAIYNLPANIMLILVGDGSKIGEARDLVSSLCIENRVLFLGFRQDIPQILSLSDVVVLSSHWEGFGLSVVEGMAAGKPVIASNVEGLREVVDDYGLLFNVGDDLTLSKHILDCYQDRAYYASLAEKSRIRAKDFDIRVTNESYLKIYSSLIG